MSVANAARPGPGPELGRGHPLIGAIVVHTSAIPSSPSNAGLQTQAVLLAIVGGDEHLLTPREA